MTRDLLRAFGAVMAIMVAAAILLILTVPWAYKIGTLYFHWVLQ